MTKVDFYVQPGQDARQRLVLACKLTEKAYRLGLKIHIRAASDHEARTLDDLLWTFRQGSFIPHVLADSPSEERAEVPVLVGPPALSETGGDLLINLAPDTPPDLSRYARLAELVNADEAIRQPGRERFRQYKGMGLEIETHELSE
jgi:DNA polymerase-3 subunit chi